MYRVRTRFEVFIEKQVVSWWPIWITICCTNSYAVSLQLQVQKCCIPPITSAPKHIQNIQRITTPCTQWPTLVSDKIIQKYVCASSHSVVQRLIYFDARNVCASCSKRVTAPQWKSTISESHTYLLLNFGWLLHVHSPCIRFTSSIISVFWFFMTTREILHHLQSRPKLECFRRAV